MRGKGKKGQASKRGEDPNTCCLGGGFRYCERPLLSIYPPSVGAKGLQPLSRVQYEADIYRQHQGGHPFRDDSPEGSQLNIYNSTSQRGIQGKEGDMEVGPLGLNTPKSNKKQLRGDFLEKVLPPRATEVENFAVLKNLVLNRAVPSSSSKLNCFY